MPAGAEGWGAEQLVGRESQTWARTEPANSDWNNRFGTSVKGVRDIASGLIAARMPHVLC